MCNLRATYLFRNTSKQSCGIACWVVVAKSCPWWYKSGSLWYRHKSVTLWSVESSPTYKWISPLQLFFTLKALSLYFYLFSSLRICCSNSTAPLQHFCCPALQTARAWNRYSELTQMCGVQEWGPNAVASWWLGPPRQVLRDMPWICLLTQACQNNWSSTSNILTNNLARHSMQYMDIMMPVIELWGSWRVELKELG